MEEEGNTSVERMRQELIKRELETTPWEAKLDLAVKKVSLEVEKLRVDEVHKFMVERLQNSSLTINEARAELVEHIIKACRKDEIVEHVRQALQAEYSSMSTSDIETLYKLFIADGGGFSSKPLKVVSVFDK